MENICDHCNVAHLLLFSTVSPLGNEVNVFDACSRGVCKCYYSIGGVPSQLKPCRFASIILDPCNKWAENYVKLLWNITDGFPIVDSAVQEYECENYSSITCVENKSKMDIIIRRELE